MVLRPTSRNFDDSNFLTTYIGYIEVIGLFGNESGDRVLEPAWHASALRGRHAPHVVGSNPGA